LLCIRWDYYHQRPQWHCTVGRIFQSLTSLQVFSLMTLSSALFSHIIIGQGGSVIIGLAVFQCWLVRRTFQSPSSLQYILLFFTIGGMNNYIIYKHLTL
jgi:hypothetical protein